MKLLLLIIAASILISCGKDSDSSGNAPAPIVKGKLPKSLTVEGTTRDYILYVPESYTGAPAPLLFSFHGYGRDMQANYDSTEFYKLADSQGFLVIHPQGVAVNGNRIWNTTNLPGVYDIPFFDSMLEATAAEYAVDANKVYSTGLSNGAYFSFVLACQRQSKVAAIAPVAGGMTTWTSNNCDHSEVVPVLEIHGDDDKVVNYDNNVPGVVDFWVTRNGASSTANVSKVKDTANGDPATVEKYTYANSTGTAVVEHLKIIGGRHRWPGGGDNDDIDASAAIWDFLKAHSL